VRKRWFGTVEALTPLCCETGSATPQVNGERQVLGRGPKLHHPDSRNLKSASVWNAPQRSRVASNAGWLPMDVRARVAIAGRQRPHYSPTVRLAGFFGRNDAGTKVESTKTTAITNTAV